MVYPSVAWLGHLMVVLLAELTAGMSVVPLVVQLVAMLAHLKECLWEC